VRAGAPEDRRRDAAGRRSAVDVGAEEVESGAVAGVTAGAGQAAVEAQTAIGVIEEKAIRPARPAAVAVSHTATTK
jgi:hypothetical protein